MNHVSQRAHRTVTASLEKRVSDLEVLTVALGNNTDYLKRQADEQAALVAAHISTSTRWQRLRWVLGV